MQLGYISKQLGHADVAVTARHYAKWCGADGYRDPMPRLAGEVPADLLARLPLESDPTVTPLNETAESGVGAKPSAALRNLGGAEGDRTPDPQTASHLRGVVRLRPRASDSVQLSAT